MQQLDTTTTHCPYCNKPRDFIWREISVAKLGGMPHMAAPITAIEIYCQSCHRTLSVTPLEKL